MRADDGADAVELEMILRGRHAVGESDARAYLVQHGVADSADHALALDAMRWRQRVLGDAYPFVSDGVGLRLSGNGNGSAYLPMLLMTHRGVVPARGGRERESAEVVFERLVAAAMTALLGPQSAAVRFGWPSDEGRPRDFPGAVRWLSGLMGVAVGPGYRPPQRQDGGVDVVAWRSFGDGRPGFPIFLVQATLGRQFVHKSADVDVRLWARWLDLEQDPATALAIPHVVPAGEDWNSMAARTIVLDRIRLSALMAGRPVPAAVASWTDNVLASLRADH